MRQEVIDAKTEATQAHYLYDVGAITKDEALQRVTQFVDLHNEAAIRLGKEYKMKARTITADFFLRKPIR